MLSALYTILLICIVITNLLNLLIESKCSIEFKKLAFPYKVCTIFWRKFCSWSYYSYTACLCTQTLAYKKVKN